MFYLGDGEMGTTDTVDITVPPVSQTHRLNGLETDTSYVIEIAAGNSVGFGPPYATSFKTTPPLPLPAAPSNVQVVSKSSSGVVLSCKASELGSPFTFFVVKVFGDDGTSVQEFRLKAEDLVSSGDGVYQLEVGKITKIRWSFFENR